MRFSSTDTVIDVRMFGALELKSEHGCLVENHGEKPLLFRLLKYLLLEPQREATYDEVLRLVWNDKAVAASAAKVRLLRLREILEPLQPEGSKSLITFRSGTYSLNPDYTLKFDTDTFLALIEGLSLYQLNEPKGLRQCQEALELICGPLLAYTKDAPWLRQYRAYYQREFVRLGHETVNRMYALKNTELSTLLCARAVMLAPENEMLQKEIISFLVDHQMEDDLARYVEMLAQTGKAKWLRNIDRSTPDQTGSAAFTEEENVIMVRLFGDVELQNNNGHIIENRSRTPLLFLKYLLINPHKETTTAEILQLWPPSKPEADPDATMAVRLSRARTALKPLDLHKKDGLIHYRKGVYKINSNYTLKRDIDEFEDILSQLSSHSLEMPEGLKLCVEALEIFRGPLMAYTQSAPWLEEYRNYYRDKFCQLAGETLNRMKALKMDEPLSLLSQRAVEIAPECQDLHESIICYLMERKKELDIIRYLYLLTRTGKANWMETSPLAKQSTL